MCENHSNIVPVLKSYSYSINGKHHTVKKNVSRDNIFTESIYGINLFDNRLTDAFTIHLDKEGELEIGSSRDDAFPMHLEVIVEFSIDKETGAIYEQAFHITPLILHTSIINQPDEEALKRNKIYYKIRDRLGGINPETFEIGFCNLTEVQNPWEKK